MKPTIKFNLPTILTLSRIVVIPFFLWITPTHPILGAIIFSLASITDSIDGYLARRYGQITDFGIIMDPIADKFLVISAIILLVSLDSLSVWLAVIVIVREFSITALRVVALSKNIIIKAEMGGKLKTIFQIIGIICLILQDYLYGIDLVLTGLIIFWISVVLAVFSGIQYSIRFWKES